MSIIELYNDYGIQYSTEGHKHCRPGWAQVACPFCTGNPGMHLGCNIDTGHFSCWRCGGKSTDKALQQLLGIDWRKAKELSRQYKVSSTHRHTQAAAEATVRFKPHKGPSGLVPLLPHHARYLERRKFNAEQIVEEWGIQSTGPLSKLDKIRYKHRIFIPIMWEGKQVSFQTRDVTGQSDLKYISCPAARETVPHKHIIYQHPELDAETVVCVEGVTDVWRLGRHAVATFGIEFTTKQVRVLARQFKRVIVLFDDESQAQKQGDMLVSELQFRGVESEKIVIEGDPGDMWQADANKLMKEIT